MHKEESRFYSEKHEYKVLYKCSRGDWVCIKVVLFTFFFHSLFFSFFFLSPFQSLFQYSLLSLYTSTFLTSSPSISTSPPSSFDTCYLSHLKQVVEKTYLAVTCTVQVTFSSMRLIKLLSTIMWMQQATLGQKLPYCILTSTLFRF